MTAKQFDQLPAEGSRYELLDGAVIEASAATPKHNRLLMLLGTFWTQHLLPGKSGMVLPDAEFAFGDQRFQPGVAVILGPRQQQVDEERVPARVTPDIAVEVISPSESAHRVERKLSVDLEAGVGAFWMLYPETQRVYVYTKDAMRRAHETDPLTGSLLPGWSSPLSDLFQDW